MEEIESAVQASIKKEFFNKISRIADVGAERSECLLSALMNARLHPFFYYQRQENLRAMHFYTYRAVPRGIEKGAMANGPLGVALTANV
jgi:hypothetical protein